MSETYLSIRALLLATAISGIIGVSIGAIGAHSLPGYLKSKNLDEAKISLRLEQCEKGVRYQMYNTLASLAICFGIVALTKDGRNANVTKHLKRAGWLLVAGTILFSGGLYIIVFTGAPAHWIVPFGGLSMIAAWVLVGLAATKLAQPV